jgi:hypothetical protein
MNDPKRFVRIEYTDGDLDGVVYGTSGHEGRDGDRTKSLVAFLAETHPGSVVRRVCVVRMNGETEAEDEVIKELRVPT